MKLTYLLEIIKLIDIFYNDYPLVQIDTDEDAQQWTRNLFEVIDNSLAATNLELNNFSVNLRSAEGTNYKELKLFWPIIEITLPVGINMLLQLNEHIVINSF